MDLVIKIPEEVHAETLFYHAELVTMLNGVEVPAFLTLRTFLMKVLGAVAAVAASLPLGYQGVMLHIGGMIANGLAAVLPHFELAQVRM
jgi:H+/Cl- antiporter ClcA